MIDVEWSVSGASRLDSTVLDLITLPETGRTVFARPPLVLAMCQVKFTRVLSVAEPKFVAPFQRAILGQYPIAVPAQQISLQVGIGPGEGDLRPTPPSFNWQFSDKEQNWSVVLGEDFCTIESRAYDHFDHFLDRLRHVLTALLEHIEPPVGTRIGLRYINEIRLDGLSERDVVRPEVLGPVGVEALTGRAEQVASLQQLLLRYSDDQGVNIHHGRVLAGSTVTRVTRRRGESVKDGPFYLLDFDVFREFPLPEGLLMEVEEVCGHVDSYHRVIDRLFRWAVTDEYVKSMGVRDDARR